MKRRVSIIVGVIMAIALAVGVSIFIFTGQSNEKSFELTATEFAFHGLGYSDVKGGPTLKVKVGDTVKITLRNEGAVEHELMVITEDELNKVLEAAEHGEHDHEEYSHPEPFFTGAIIHDLERGQMKTAVFIAEKPGTYIYACFVEKPEIHVKLGMFGKIIVEP